MKAVYLTNHAMDATGCLHTGKVPWEAEEAMRCVFDKYMAFGSHAFKDRENTMLKSKLRELEVGNLFEVKGKSEGVNRGHRASNVAAKVQSNRPNKRVKNESGESGEWAGYNTELLNTRDNSDDDLDDDVGVLPEVRMGARHTETLQPLCTTFAEFAPAPAYPMQSSLPMDRDTNMGAKLDEEDRAINIKTQTTEKGVSNVYCLGFGTGFGLGGKEDLRPIGDAEMEYNTHKLRDVNGTTGWAISDSRTADKPMLQPLSADASKRAAANGPANNHIYTSDQSKAHTVVATTVDTVDQVLPDQGAGSQHPVAHTVHGRIPPLQPRTGGQGDLWHDPLPNPAVAHPGQVVSEMELTAPRVTKTASFLSMSHSGTNDNNQSKDVGVGAHDFGAGDPRKAGRIQAGVTSLDLSECTRTTSSSKDAPGKLGERPPNIKPVLNAPPDNQTGTKKNRKPTKKVAPKRSTRVRVARNPMSPAHMVTKINKTTI